MTANVGGVHDGFALAARFVTRKRSESPGPPPPTANFLASPDASKATRARQRRVTFLPALQLLREPMPSGTTRPSLALRSREDLDLAARCVAGDERAQRELFTRERRRVHATLFRVLGSNSSMDDLVQDAFLEVFRSLSTFRGDASLSTWIDRCTVNVALTHLRRKRPKLVEMVHEPASHAPSPEHQVLLREAGRRLYAELDRMAPNARVALTLHVIDERPLAEVAAAMNASVVATKVRVWRARQHLLACFARDTLLGDVLRAARSEGP